MITISDKEKLIGGIIFLAIVAPSLLFTLLIEFAPFIIFIGIGIAIVWISSNKIAAFFGLGAYTSFLQVILYLIPNSSNFYLKTEASMSLISVSSIESVFDLVLMVESANWNVWGHLLATVLFGVISFGITRATSR